MMLLIRTSTAHNNWEYTLYVGHHYREFFSNFVKFESPTQITVLTNVSSDSAPTIVHKMKKGSKENMGTLLSDTKHWLVTLKLSKLEKGKILTIQIKPIWQG